MKRLALYALAVLALIAAGCGDDDKEDEGGGSADAKAVALELTGSGKKVTMKAPASVEAGLVKITLKNSLKGEGGAQIVRIEGNHTPAEVGKAGAAWGDKGKPLPNWLKLEGGTGSAKPGGSKSVTQTLKPGNYLVADLESNASARMKVTGSQAGDEPTAGPRIDAVEYRFKTSGLKAGKQTVLFDNKGKEPHFIVGGPLKAGKTIADARKAAMSDSGPPPFDEKASFDTAVIDGGRKQAVELDLKKGKYALLCFIPDRQGGPPHVAKGMVSEGVVE